MFLVNIFQRPLKFKYNPEMVTNSLARYLYTLKRGSRIKPFRLFVYPTALCNDNCRYCSDGLRAGEERLKVFLKYETEKDFFNSREYINKLIKDIKKLKIKDIHLFGGGEPFFYKENMFYFLERLKNTDIFIRVITNAKNLNEDDVEYVIKNKLISQLNISLNTDSEETAKKLYAESSRHYQTLDVIKNIAKYKALYKTEFPKLDIMFTILNVNYNKISGIITLLKDFRINYFFLQPLRCYSDKQKEYALSKKEENDFLGSVMDIEKELQKNAIRSNIDDFKRDERLSYGKQNPAGSSVQTELKNKYNCILKCYMPLTTLSLCYNGNIPFCQFKYDKHYSQNYFNLMSLRDFIKGKEYTSFVKRFIDEGLSEVCNNCNFCVPSELGIIKQRFINFSQKR